MTARASTAVRSGRLPKYSADGWLFWPRPVADPTARVVCFPYAGAGPQAYRAWLRDLPSDIELCTVSLPGRAARLREPPVTGMRELARAVAASLLREGPERLAFFGHSMGALLAFETARELRRLGGVGIDALFVSAYGAPDLPPAGALHKLPDAQLIQQIGALGATPPAILGDAGLMELLLPAIRADVAACETYAYYPEPPLDCSITAFGGRDDGLARAESLGAWRRHTTSRFSSTTLPGAHFFIFDSQAELLGAMRDELRLLN